MYNFGVYKLFRKIFTFFWSGPGSRSPDGSRKDGGGYCYIKNIMLTWNFFTKLFRSVFPGLVGLVSVWFRDWIGRFRCVTVWVSTSYKGCKGVAPLLGLGGVRLWKFFLHIFQDQRVTSFCNFQNMAQKLACIVYIVVKSIKLWLSISLVDNHKIIYHFSL